MSSIQILEVFLHQQPIGTITNLPGDKNIFIFNQEYIDDPLRPTLSLSFMDALGDLIIDVKPVRTRVLPFFSNLLPEGHLREYLASKAQVNSAREFLLLAALGEDLPGALQIGSVHHKPLSLHVGQEIEQSQDVEPEGILHFSLAGVQLKFSAIWENHGRVTIPAHGVGGGWIVKLPSSSFAGVPENEYSMMELARRVGINVPRTALIPLEQIQGLPKDVQLPGMHAFVIKRFDRSDSGEAIHIEDFAQVFGVFPEKKYRTANYRNIAEVIKGEVGEKGVMEFIRRFVFNALIGNGDMHLKNWSLIYPDRKHAALAPAYDFVSTIFYLPGDRLALNFLDSKSFSALTLEQFKRFASKVKVPEKLVLDTVLETVSLFADAWKSKDDLPVDGQVIDAIQKHLKTIPIAIF